MKTAREITLEKENQELKSKVDSLQNQLDAVLKMLAGKKSEKRTDLLIDQLNLFGDSVVSSQEEEIESLTITRKKRKGTPVRKSLQENLSREIVEIYL